jgi:hypothetical protein
MKYCVEQKHQHGTIRSHLMTLGHFYDFLILTTPDLNDDPVKRISSSKETAKRWAASYRRDANQRSLEKMDEDLHNIILPPDIAKFQRSEVTKAAVKLLDSIAEMNTTLTKSEYTIVRDYLLSDIILHNANRPGVLANLTYPTFLSRLDTFLFSKSFPGSS